MKFLTLDLYSSGTAGTNLIPVDLRARVRERVAVALALVWLRRAGIL